LGVGQLAAGFVGEPASPVLAVGQTAIDASPEWLRSFAIRTFGASDKTVLVAGIIVVIAIASAVLGVASLRRPWIGYAGLAVLGTIGVAAALGRPGAGPSWALPPLLATLAGAGAFATMRVAGRPRGDRRRRGHTALVAQAPTGFDRRRFLQAAITFGAAAVTSDRLGAYVNGRMLADASRAAVGIPRPASPAPPLPPGAELHVPGLSPFFTPNADFYRVDTTLFVPRIRVEDWKLRIHGMVDREIELDFEQLLARPLIERDITLNCVSNPVGGGYIGNARWIGVPLNALLAEAGVHPGASQIVSRSRDGMTIGTPTELALDGRDSMLAIAMNGEPLPFEHGFPVRLLVPGLYGYESATKWLVDIELTTLTAFAAYWVQRGWAQVAPIQTMSRIDTPNASTHLRAGVVKVAGVAWAQHRGISRVEVRVDDGPWNEATLSAQDSIDTWRQWTWSWNAAPGPHLLAVRATDDAGAVQTGRWHAPFPSGATGWHQIAVTVS